MLLRSLALPGDQARNTVGIHFKDQFADRLALQRQSIALAKKQIDRHHITIDDSGDSWQPSGASDPAEEDTDVALVLLPLAMQGPAAVTWQLIQDAESTEEQIDAVSLLALFLQKRFDGRPDKKTHFLPVSTPDNNHRAVWLGGGGVGKTHTLTKVVEPLGLIKNFLWVKWLYPSCTSQPRSTEPGPARQNTTRVQRSAHDRFSADGQAATQ